MGVHINGNGAKDKITQKEGPKGKWKAELEDPEHAAIIPVPGMDDKDLKEGVFNLHTGNDPAMLKILRIQYFASRHRSGSNDQRIIKTDLVLIMAQKGGLKELLARMHRTHGP